MKVKLILISTICMSLVMLLCIGTYAYFVSQSKSTENVFSTGTLTISSVCEIPQPLFCSYPRYWGDPWATGEWYPGKTISGKDRSLVIKNSGTLPAKIYGISAVMSEFNNPLGNSNAQEEFTKNLIITVRNRDYQYYKGPLIDLLSKTCELKKNNEFIILYPEGPDDSRMVDLNFEASMDETAGNAAQGVTAKVDLIIHATGTV